MAKESTWPIKDQTYVGLSLLNPPKLAPQAYVHLSPHLRVGPKEEFVWPWVHERLAPSLKPYLTCTCMKKQGFLCIGE